MMKKLIPLVLLVLLGGASARDAENPPAGGSPVRCLYSPLVGATICVP